MRVRVQAVRYAAPSVSSFEFQLQDGGLLPAFSAGAHIDVYLPNGLIRQYSLLSPPEDLSRYVVGVKRDPHSRGGSSFMFESVRVGDVMLIGSPRNHFALNESASSTVLVAGGIGITPILCMAGRLNRLGMDWRLFYAVRRREEAAFLADLPFDRRRVVVHVDEENGGRPLDLAAIVASAPDTADMYCCGPAPMLDCFEAVCAGRPAARVHLERFAPAEVAATDGGFEVELARAGLRIRVKAGESIAGALAKAGATVPVSCEQGICGTCETRVISGIPDHRDSLLTAEERAANNVMFVCCSGSLSPKLVLDL